jgi:hypothetical protein
VPIDGGVIAAQTGASAGLWTRTPVDWRGNETGNPTPPGGWPANAAVEIPPNGSRNAGLAAAISAVSVTGISATTATVNYTLSVAASSQVEYGTTTAYGTARPVSPNVGSGAQTAALSALTTATTYHYRVFAVVAGVATYSPDATFTTA